jgi:hypothetical protein
VNYSGKYFIHYSHIALTLLEERDLYIAQMIVLWVPSTLRDWQAVAVLRFPLTFAGLWWLAVQTEKSSYGCHLVLQHSQYRVKTCSSGMCRAYVLMFDEEDLPLVTAACVVIADTVFFNTPNSF